MSQTYHEAVVRPPNSVILVMGSIRLKFLIP